VPFDRDKTKISMFPDRDWMFVVVFFVICAVVVVGVHYYLFVKLADRALFANDVENTGKIDYASMLDVDKLKQAQQFFDSKSVAFEKASHEDPSTIIDPSL